jgi:hypothetical protein
LIVTGGHIQPLRRALEVQADSLSGGIFYSVYLFHGTAMMMLTAALHAPKVSSLFQQFTAMLVAPPLSIAVGYLFFRVGKRFFSPRSLAAAHNGTAEVFRPPRKTASPLAGFAALFPSSALAKLCGGYVGSTRLPPRVDERVLRHLLPVRARAT